MASNSFFFIFLFASVKYPCTTFSMARNSPVLEPSKAAVTQLSICLVRFDLPFLGDFVVRSTELSRDESSEAALQERLTLLLLALNGSSDSSAGTSSFGFTLGERFRCRGKALLAGFTPGLAGESHKLSGGARDVAGDPMRFRPFFLDCFRGETEGESNPGNFRRGVSSSSSPPSMRLDILALIESDRRNLFSSIRFCRLLSSFFACGVVVHE